MRRDLGSPLTNTTAGARPAGSAKSCGRRVYYARRRDPRVQLRMPVRIYGYGADKEPFVQDTSTLNVSARGALITLTTVVHPERWLILTNAKTQEEVVCRVAHFRATERGKTQVGIQFVNPAPRFWRMAFPPGDWDPAERKRPVSRS